MFKFFQYVTLGVALALTVVGERLKQHQLPSRNFPYEADIYTAETYHNHTLILFHGMDSSVEYFPVIPLTAKNFTPTKAWFDMINFDFAHGEDDAGIYKAVNNVHKIIDSETEQGIPANKIFVLGFSQGGALTITSGIRYKKRLGGIIVLSGFLPQMSQLESTVNLQTPIFWGVGKEESPGYTLLTRNSIELLNKYNFAPEFKDYDGLAHDHTPEEMLDVREFINKRL